MRLSLKSQLMSCVFAASSLALASASHAQDTPPEEAEEDVAVQELVTVTGSRGKPRSVQDLSLIHI